MKKSLLFILCATMIGVSSCNSTETSNSESLSNVESESTQDSVNTESSSVKESLPSEESSVEEIVKPDINYYKRGKIANAGLNENNLANDVQDGLILHAWNWSYNTIKDNLASIGAACYSTIQTSPVQQSKSTSTTGSWSSSWAMLYQPVSFAIAETSWLGTKQDLMDLCVQAENYGIKIICDVVLNHMANDNTGQGYSERINEYEPEIYQNKETYFHQYDKSVSDISAKDVTQGKLSNLPDLNTSNEYIQQRALDLLKECVDCGVSGFRFDAAKHIETPDDGAFGSSFWTNLLTSTTQYAQSTYDKNIYYYGEILNTPGDGRNIESYTKMMSITDTEISGTIRQAVNSRNLEDIVSYGLNYTGSEDGKKSVVWVESHDTFADGSTAKLSDKKINRTWAVNASRSGATSLYLARPEENTAMGKRGLKTFKNPEVSAINNFHNKFMNAEECISVQGDYFVNERSDKENSQDGIVLVKIGLEDKSEDINLYLDSVKDGTYYDQVSGGKFTVSNGILKGKNNETGIIVLTEQTPVITPIINVSIEEGYFYDSIEVDVTASNYEELSYTVNDGQKIVITDKKLVLTSDSDITLKVFANNDQSSAQEVFKYYKVEKREGYVACAGLMDPENCEIYAWVWKGSTAGKWAQVEVVGNVAYLQVDESIDHYLLVSFPKGYKFETLSSSSWNDKIGQTSDFKIDEDVIETSTI